MEHAQALVSPHAYKLIGILEPIGHTQAQALIHAGQVAQVENVVKLGRGGRMILNDLSVKLQGGRCDRVGHFFDVFTERLKVAVQDGRVDLL